MAGDKESVFRVGNLYTHEEIYTRLSVGNAGGIRPCVGRDGETRRLVVMTSEPSGKVLRENPYHDRVEGDILVYTAAGLEGNQAFSGMNRRLLDQIDAPFPIYGFCNIGSRRDTKLGKRRWRFIGLLQYLRHFMEKQADTRGQHRDSVVFELVIHNEPSEIPIDHDREISAEICSLRRQSTRDESEREVQTEVPNNSPFVSLVNSAVVEETRRTLLTLRPERFEQVIKQTLEATGFERVTVTRYANDGGIDVNGFAGPQLWPYRGGLLQVQAKRWLHTVGRREVAELRGSMQPRAQGAIVTTSFYSKAAIAEAIDPVKKPVVLVNGLEFAAVLARIGYKL